MITEELLNTDPENKVRYISKEVISANNPPKVMNCRSYPRMNFGGEAVTEVQKRKVLTVTPQS